MRGSGRGADLPRACLRHHRRVEGKKPALADHASDDMAFLALIKAILRDLVAAASEVSQAIIQWFAHFFDEPRAEWDFKTKHDWYTHREKLDLRTLQGEKVKSYEELQIANWLYRNGIAYEYEPTYEHKLPERASAIHQPDFRLTESGVYIEHFGVRKQKMAGRQSNGWSPRPSSTATSISKAWSGSGRSTPSTAPR
jgi:DNA helicase IV